VEKTVRIFSGFRDPDEADVREHMAMSPDERIRLVIELRDRRHAAKQGLARVCRIIKREQS